MLSERWFAWSGTTSLIEDTRSRSLMNHRSAGILVVILLAFLVAFSSCNRKSSADQEKAGPEGAVHNYKTQDSITRELELNDTLLFSDLIPFEPPVGWEYESQITQEVSHSGSSAFRTDSTVEYGPGIYRNVTSLPIDTGNMFIRATIFIWPVGPFKDNPTSLIISFEREGKSYLYGAYNLGKPDNLEPGRWNRVTSRLQVPNEISSEDIVKVYIWHRGKGTLFCDDFQIELLKRKSN